ncbi:50S ribosomal protein L6 [Azospirillum brasilense]|jgi:large subunit ribosomal protein L6|uniref:Large ribosomal subunit protein uL6 n=1 Tax=Azospirillum brasilense TaxID=192 RepID=A0A0P0F780_AZOBR|nr:MULTISPECIES: 50S ribosomal protein L6 [Azospirillum]ALJ35780.1 50S ribosomal protein L6 [Azospirillum brasilense]MDW7555053.1 50S ribosomal protein L6 [Azospirillum brasilense]MDW7594830.1 50S ribosomal protein L6 [Azospirillum brasilense]MDW7629684.1 50S ribosomal protein L6 [Azospirillum brasilense]MDX5954544.1 50S ribosomal protein L6 [Azospirillum brasilense]
MSRIGKHSVPVPAGVDVAVNGQLVTAKGKLGSLSLTLIDDITAKLEDGKVVVAPANDSKRARVMWATSRTLINNMVTGVNQGFTINLEINGVGYRAAVQGKELVMQLGYSHDVKYPIPEGITIKCDKPTAISVSGFDKQKVGQVAAEIRGWKKPEPYKGKGIKYDTETIIRKEGKKK